MAGIGASSAGGADISKKELRDLELRLARKEQENKALREELEQIKKNGAANASSMDEVQNERD